MVARFKSLLLLPALGLKITCFKGSFKGKKTEGDRRGLLAAAFFNLVFFLCYYSVFGVGNLSEVSILCIVPVYLETIKNSKKAIYFKEGTFISILVGQVKAIVSKLLIMSCLQKIFCIQI